MTETWIQHKAISGSCHNWHIRELSQIACYWWQVTRVLQHTRHINLMIRQLVIFHRWCIHWSHIAIFILDDILVLIILHVKYTIEYTLWLVSSCHRAYIVHRFNIWYNMNTSCTCLLVYYVLRIIHVQWTGIIFHRHWVLTHTNLCTSRAVWYNMCLQNAVLCHIH